MPKKPKLPPRQCSRCDAIAVAGEKYCKGCRKAVLKELRDSGYIQDRSRETTFSDEIGRKHRDPRMLGGGAEFGTDGDD